MKRFKIAQAVLVILAGLFIFFSLSSVRGTGKNADEIANSVLAIMQDEDLIERDVNYIRETFAFDTESISSFAYYTSDDIMNVNELLVVVLSDTQNAESFKESINDYVDGKYAIFKDYAPVQGELLKNHFLKLQGNALVFCICENNDKISDSFKKLL